MYVFIKKIYMEKKIIIIKIKNTLKIYKLEIMCIIFLMTFFFYYFKTKFTHTKKALRAFNYKRLLNELTIGVFLNLVEFTIKFTEISLPKFYSSSLI